MSEELAPLCFGAITMYSLDADQCRSCAHYDACGVKVQAVIDEVSRVMNVDDVMKRHAELKRRRPQASTTPDSGKLKTQAPALQRNNEVATATIQPTGAVEIALKEMRSVVNALVGDGTADELRAALARGENPYPQSMTEKWILCEVLRRGPTTAAVIEAAVEKTGGSQTRKAVAVRALTAAKIIKQDGDKFLVNEV